MSDKKVVVFDFGNVLAGFDHMKTCEKLARFSPFSKEVIYSKVFESGIEAQYDKGLVSSYEFFRMVTNIILASNLIDFYFKNIWRDIFFEDPCVIDVLDRIKPEPEVEFYLLSNTNEGHWGYIKLLPVIRGHFSDPEKQILSFQVGARKPDKKIFQEVLKRAKTDPENILYIDDVPGYVRAFESFGVNGFVYNCQKDPISKLEAELSRFGVLP